MSRAPKRLTTTSYALLGLLALQPWSTYELAAQMDRGLSTFWPRARSNVYEELKKLGQGPALEWEQLVQVFFADSGSKEDLLATLRQAVSWSEQQKRFHRQR